MLEIDGAFYGRTPVLVRDLPPGEYALKMQMEGNADLHAVLEVAPAQTVIRSFALRPQQERSVVDGGDAAMTEAAPSNRRIGW